MKLVKRYWCDFCNRAGLRAHAMEKHERHCTMNPARACRVCVLRDGGNGPDAEELRALVAILPANVTPEYDCSGDPGDRFIDFQDAVAVAVPKLREAANDCPACMLAAIRQAGIPVPLAVGFDFKAEMVKLLADHAAEHFNSGLY